MNMYDNAHQLAKSIKESDEFSKYKEVKAFLDTDEKLKEVITDFQAKQMELQSQTMMTGEVDPEKMEALQKLYQTLNLNPKAAEYLQAEMMFSKMMNDIYKILGDAINFEL